MPQGTGCKGSHASTEAGLLALGRNTQVHIVAQPVVGVLIPAAQVTVRVLGGFQTPGVDVLQTVPEHLARLGVEAVVSHA